MTFNKVPNNPELVNTSLTLGSCKECCNPSGPSVV